MEERAELKRSVLSQADSNGFVSKLKALEKEAQKAKESERKMLGSLVSQTKQLEETKVALEEAKLEVRALQERIKGMDNSSMFGSRSYRNIGNYFLQNRPTYVVHAEEMTELRNALRLATEAEEKSQKAMDDLAIALTEVMTEASQLKGSLLATQSELEEVKEEAESKGSALKVMEEKYQAALEESKRLKFEIEESFATWGAKEESFTNCIKTSEEELSEAKAKNEELLESRRVARDENARLRDMLKQYASGSSVAKEDLQCARKENARLKDLLSAKEDNLQGLKQEYECLKVSEVAATERLKELTSSSLATTATLHSSKLSTSPANESIKEESAKLSKSSKGIASSERWNISNKRFQAGHRHSTEEGKSKGSVFDIASSPNRKDRLLFASLSNISTMQAAYSVIDDADTMPSDYFDYTDAVLLGNGEQTNSMQKKKRTLLRRFRDMLRRKSAQEKS